MKFYIYIENRMVAEVEDYEFAWEAYRKTCELADMLGEVANQQRNGKLEQDAGGVAHRHILGAKQAFQAEFFFHLFSSHTFPIFCTDFDPCQTIF